ncbi:MAG: hypothetical protein SGJ10_09140 [Bacteroidota bacterium]|nr:hypothetical protein [Bacteroidota bacterium]
MKSLIIILACLVTVGAHAKSGDSTSNNVEPLVPLKPNYSFNISNIKVANLSPPYSPIFYPRYFRFMPGVGTRNMNYMVNFAAKNTSIGYDEPSINGAAADGNAIFIDGVRLYDNSFGTIGIR